MLRYVIFEKIYVTAKVFEMPNWWSLLVMLLYVKSNACC